MQLVDSTEPTGTNASPILADGKKNMMIDIDGTVTDDVPNEEPERMVVAKPYAGARETINDWYEQGHIITFFTSRLSSEHKEITEQWLEKHGFKYHFLLMDKPRGGNYHWIDNHVVKGIRFTESWNLVKQELE